MRCPYCKNSDARVVDSRDADGGVAIRRRRECLGCKRRFTTFERCEALSLRVLKRSGALEPYDRDKVMDGIRRACKNRPVDDARIAAMTDEVETAVWGEGGVEVSTQELGLSVLEVLRHADDVAAVRFASVYKDFQEVTDFEREVGLLLQKKTPPKASVGSARGNG